MPSSHSNSEAVLRLMLRSKNYRALTLNKHAISELWDKTRLRLTLFSLANYDRTSRRETITTFRATV